MRVPHFLSIFLGLCVAAALSSCSRESSLKENVNLKNNHSRVFVFDKPLQDAQAFADSMTNTAVSEADTIPDTLTVTVNDTVYMIGLLPYNVDKIYRFQWTLTKADGKDTIVIGNNAKVQAWAYAKPGLYEPKFVAFDGNNATDTAGTATRKAFVQVIDTKPSLSVPKDTLWTRHDGDISFPIFASDSFGTIVSVKLDLDASGKDTAEVWKCERYEDNDSLYVTIKNTQAKIDSLGNQKIYVIVTDDDGNTTLDSVNLHFNRVPKLKVIYPQDNDRHNIKDRFYFYYEGTDEDNPQDLKYFIYAQTSKNGQPPQKAFTESDLIASEFTSNIFEPTDQNGKNVITLVNDPTKQLTGRIYWDMYVTDGYDVVRLDRIVTGEGESRPWNFYIGDLSSTQGTVSGVAKYQGRTTHSGIRVELSNGNKTYEALTDDKGNYTIKVEMGSYTATASSESSREYGNAVIKDLYIESGSIMKLDDMLLKDTVAPVILVKNFDTLAVRKFDQTIYARDLGSFIDTLSASIDGNNVPLTCSVSDGRAVYNCIFSLSSLTDGTHSLYYTVKDKAGNEDSLKQDIVIMATKIDLDVNGDKNARIGEGESLVFTATVTDAVPAPKKVQWTWDLDETSKTIDVDENGKATVTYTYEQLKTLATAGKDYIMTVSYTENGANVNTQVKFGILGDNPSIIFTEPAFDDTVSLNDPVAFKIKTYPGKASTSMVVKWNCRPNSDELATGYSCPADDTKEANLAYKAVGTYTVTVTVTDQDGKTDSASTKVIVISDPPTINATTNSNSNEYKINSIVTVKASASDKFGTINQIKWGCSNGMVVFDKDTTFATPINSVSDVPLEIQLPSAEVSNFRCIFKAIDDDAEEGLDTLIFKTNLDLPTVRLATKKDTVKINSNQTIKAIASDKLGVIIDYAVACSDNLSELKNPDWTPMSSSETAVRMPSVATDAYYCVVQVKDDDNNTARDTAVYKVIVGLPKVVAYVNYNKVTINDVVELNAHAQDSLGSIVKYEWGCGSKATENIGFTYSSTTTPKKSMTMPSTPQEGYRCIARVTDDDGNTAKDTVTIDIIVAPPTISVNQKQLTVREGYNIALNASASDNNGLPSDPGEIAKREWSCGTPSQIPSRWKTVSDFDTVWKAPAAQEPFYCVARATDNDGNSVSDTVNIKFSTDIPLIWVRDEVIYINLGDGFELDASVNDVWQGIDWFTWECKDTTGKTLESSVPKYDYTKNGKSFKIGKDSTYSMNGKNMYCIVSAQETSTKATFSDTTVVRLMQQHPVGVISAADTVYLWSGDESVDDEALYFYTPDWNGKKSKMGDLGDQNLQDYWWRFSNVDANYYQGSSDGSLDTNTREFNAAFIRRTSEGSMTIYLDYRDSTSSTPTTNFYGRHRAAEVSRTVYFSKAWKNLSDTVIANTPVTVAPGFAVVNNVPAIAYITKDSKVELARYGEDGWVAVESPIATANVKKLSAVSLGNDFYVAVLENSGSLTIYKSAGGTSPLAKVGSAISSIYDVKLVSKSSESAPHAVVISNTDRKIYMYDYSGSSWNKNTKFDKIDGDYSYAELDATYNENGTLTVIGVSTTYAAYYGYFSASDYSSLAKTVFCSADVGHAKIISSGSNIYMVFNSRDVNYYGPRLVVASLKTNSISWPTVSAGNNKVSLTSSAVHEGLFANNISLATYNGIIYAAFDDRAMVSQVNVYRYEGNKWHLHGENQLPYFNTVFYENKGYYLRGLEPSLVFDKSGKLYLSMIAHVNGNNDHHNNGPLVMKYVADNWEIK